MGSVYRGERETGDFLHVTAIKIIKPGLLSESLVERFERERQTLASLKHPNIAQLYDGGATESGRSEEHTSELQSLMRTSYAVFCLKKKKSSRYNTIHSLLCESATHTSSFHYYSLNNNR